MKSRFVQHGVIAQPHQIIMELLEANNKNAFTEGTLRLFKSKAVLLLAGLVVVGLLYRFAIPSMLEAIAILAISYLLVTLAMVFFKAYNMKVESASLKAIALFMAAMVVFIVVLSMV